MGNSESSSSSAAANVSDTNYAQEQKQDRDDPDSVSLPSTSITDEPSVSLLSLGEITESSILRVTEYDVPSRRLRVVLDGTPAIAICETPITRDHHILSDWAQRRTTLVAPPMIEVECVRTGIDDRCKSFRDAVLPLDPSLSEEYLAECSVDMLEPILAYAAMVRGFDINQNMKRYGRTILEHMCFYYHADDPDDDGTNISVPEFPQGTYHARKFTENDRLALVRYLLECGAEITDKAWELAREDDMYDSRPKTRLVEYLTAHSQEAKDAVPAPAPAAAQQLSSDQIISSLSDLFSVDKEPELVVDSYLWVRHLYGPAEFRVEVNETSLLIKGTFKLDSDTLDEWIARESKLPELDLGTPLEENRTVHRCAAPYEMMRVGCTIMDVRSVRDALIRGFGINDVIPDTNDATPLERVCDRYWASEEDIPNNYGSILGTYVVKRTSEIESLITAKYLLKNGATLTSSAKELAVTKFDWGNLPEAPKTSLLEAIEQITGEVLVVEKPDEKHQDESQEAEAEDQAEAEPDQKQVQTNVLAVKPSDLELPTISSSSAFFITSFDSSSNSVSLLINGVPATGTVSVEPDIDILRVWAARDRALPPAETVRELEKPIPVTASMQQRMACATSIQHAPTIRDCIVRGFDINAPITCDVFDPTPFEKICDNYQVAKEDPATDFGCSMNWSRDDMHVWKQANETDSIACVKFALACGAKITEKAMEEANKECGWGSNARPKTGLLKMLQDHDASAVPEIKFDTDALASWSVEELVNQVDLKLPELSSSSVIVTTAVDSDSGTVSAYVDGVPVKLAFDVVLDQSVIENWDDNDGKLPAALSSATLMDDEVYPSNLSYTELMHCLLKNIPDASAVRQCVVRGVSVNTELAPGKSCKFPVEILAEKYRPAKEGVVMEEEKEGATEWWRVTGDTSIHAANVTEKHYHDTMRFLLDAGATITFEAWQQAHKGYGYGDAKRPKSRLLGLFAEYASTNNEDGLDATGQPTLLPESKGIIDAAIDEIEDDLKDFVEFSNAKALGLAVAKVYKHGMKALVNVVRPYDSSKPFEALSSLGDRLFDACVSALVSFGKHIEKLDESEQTDVSQKVFSLGMGLMQDGDTWNVYCDKRDLLNNGSAFNTITQYAFFDLLKKQNPEEAERLGL
jgi:hypothetical protein